MNPVRRLRETRGQARVSGEPGAVQSACYQWSLLLYVTRVQR